jgi:hypothetical protein
MKPTASTKPAPPRSGRGPTKLMTLQQAHQEYGPPYTSLRDLVVEGTLPSVRLGSSTRIWVRRADLERLIDVSRDRP